MVEDIMVKESSFLSTLWKFKKSIIILLVPLLFLPLLVIGDSQVPKCGYVICVMAIFWATEACPLPVTSLIPVVLFPLLGIQSADTVSMNYMRNINFLAIGTITVCIAIEEWNLHKRFAMRILLFLGSKPCWIILGLMIITAFLSMWLSNTSTVALMYPVTMAVCKEITLLNQKKTRRQRNEIKLTVLGHDHEESDKACASGTNSQESNELLNDEIEFKEQGISDHEHVIQKKDVKLEKAMLIAVAYASSLGGICTTVGTPSNFIALGIFSTTYGGKDEEVNFLSWFGFCFPLSVLSLLIAWLWIQIRFLSLRDLKKSKKDDSSTAVHTMLRDAYDALPPMRFAEIVISVHFILLILLWFFRDPKVIPGWKSGFPGSYAKDSTAAVFIGLSIFLFPSKASSFSWIWKSRNKDVVVSGPSAPLLEWKTFQEKFPWNVLLLLGSGFALAGGCVDSGLSEWFGQCLTALHGTPTWVITLVITITISVLTEFTSNVATASIFLPILLGMSREMQLHPVQVLLAGTLSCSFAFSLPTATPPNAMAFSYGTLRVKDLILTGIPMNLICVVLLNLFIPLIGTPIFGLNTIPEWAMLNSTTTGTTLAP